MDWCESVIKHVAQYVARFNVHALLLPDSTKTVRNRVNAARARRCRAPAQRSSKHHIILSNGLYKCSRCIRTSSDPARIDKHPCWLALARHNLWIMNRYWFCVKCGAYAYQRSVKLCTGCMGSPNSRGKARVLRQLLHGKDPYSGRSIGLPMPVVLREPDNFQIGGILLPRQRLHAKS